MYFFLLRHIGTVPRVGLSWRPSTLFARTCQPSVGTSQAVIHHIIQVHNVSGSYVISLIETKKRKSATVILRWQNQVVSWQVNLPTEWCWKKKHLNTPVKVKILSLLFRLAWPGWARGGCLDSWTYPALSCPASEKPQGSRRLQRLCSPF